MSLLMVSNQEMFSAPVLQQIKWDKMKANLTAVLLAGNYKRTF